MAKKCWEKPQLVILSRGKPEENVVLEGCMDPPSCVPPGSGHTRCFNSKAGVCTTQCFAEKCS